MPNLFDDYNNSSTKIKNNYDKLKQHINDLSNNEYLEKEKTVELMYIETSKLENKEYILFVSTSILTTIIIMITYKIVSK
jgi:type I restriction-modification system DNA methylase subunit